MKIQAIVHKAAEGGFWAEVPAIPGCATQGDSMDELMRNLREAIAGCLSVPLDHASKLPDDEVIEIAAAAPFAIQYSPPREEVFHAGEILVVCSGHLGLRMSPGRSLLARNFIRL